MNTLHSDRPSILASSHESKTTAEWILVGGCHTPILLEAKDFEAYQRGVKDFTVWAGIASAAIVGIGLLILTQF